MAAAPGANFMNQSLEQISPEIRKNPSSRMKTRGNFLFKCWEIPPGGTLTTKFFWGVPSRQASKYYPGQMLFNNRMIKLDLAYPTRHGRWLYKKRLKPAQRKYNLLNLICGFKGNENKIGQSPVQRSCRWTRSRRCAAEASSKPIRRRRCPESQPRSSGRRTCWKKWITKLGEKLGQGLRAFRFPPTLKKTVLQWY